jgi:PEP-CTERM motif
MPRLNASQPLSTLVAAAVLCLCAGATQAQSIVANFAGLSLAQTNPLVGRNYAPPDTMGAIGPNNFVEFINGGYAVYNRTGSLVTPAVSDTTFWLNAGAPAALVNQGLSDTRIKFDPLSNRWFATEITLGAAATGNANNSVLLAVSNTANPLDGWKSTNFNVAGATRFNDYPTLGIDANAVYIGSNDFNGAGTAFLGNTLSSIPKSSLLGATPTTTGISSFVQGATAAMGSTPQGVTNYGTGYTTGKVLGNSNTVDFGKIQVSTLSNTATTATLGPATAVTVLDGSPTQVRQPNGSRVVDGLDQRISGTIYQVGNKIYAVNAINPTNQTFSTTAPGSNAVHWMVLDATTNTLLQEGLITDGTRDLWQPSIAANANGDVVIGYNKAGTDLNISSFAAVGKTVGGVLSFGSQLLLKTSPVNNYTDGFGAATSRWGDYSATMVDPTDPNVFWTIQEVAVGATTWGTQISAINVTTAVPEPQTYALLLAGLCAVGAVVRKRAARP